MNLIVVGGPVVGKLLTEITPEKSFGDIFVSIQEAVGDGQLWEKFQLHVAEVKERRVRPTPRVIRPGDTAESLRLPPSAAVVMLRPATAAGDVAGNDVSPSRAVGDDYRSRMIAMYEKYEPSKVGTVDAILRKYCGKEDAVIRQLVKKYGPEPDDVVSGGKLPQASASEESPEPAFPNQTSDDKNAKVANYRERLVAIYQKYDPSKVRLVSAVLKKFEGKEEAVIKKLIKTYGPEPPLFSSPPPQQSVATGAAIPTVSTTDMRGEDGNGKTVTPARGILCENEETSYRSRMIAMYEKYEPSKVGTVDAILRRYCGKEDAVIRQLVKKYGPEPDAVNSGSQQFLTDKTDNTPDISFFASLDLPELEKGEVTPEALVSRNECAQAGARNVAAEQCALTLSNTENAVPESCSLRSSKLAVNHGPLVEHMTEGDENSAGREMKKTESGVTGMCGSLTNSSFPEVAVVLGPDLFGAQNCSLDARRQSTIELQTPSGHHCDAERAECIKAAHRLRHIALRAVGLFSEAVVNVLRRVYWEKWQRKVAQSMARDLLENGIWEKTNDGAKLVDSVPHIYSVPDLESHIFEKRIRVRETNADFSDELQRTLRALLYTTRQHLINTEGTEDKPLIHDEELCPVQDTKRLSSALCTIASVMNDFAETKGELELRRCEVERLLDVNEDLWAQLNRKESSLSCSLETKETVDVFEGRCKMLEDQLRRSQDALTAANCHIKDLELRIEEGKKNVRTADTELLLQQKDTLVASLQQELAKVRSRLRFEQKKKKDVSLKLEEMQRVTERTKRKLHHRSLSNVVEKKRELTREMFSRPHLLKDVSSPVVKGRPMAAPSEARVEFLPHGADVHKDTTTRLGEMTDADLLRDNLRLELELRQLQHAPAECRFGDCPHCVTQLTACSFAPTGPPDSKAAFCFSCRRCFTFADLALLNTRRKKEGAKGGVCGGAFAGKAMRTRETNEMT